MNAPSQNPANTLFPATSMSAKTTTLKPRKPAAQRSAGISARAPIAPAILNGAAAPHSAFRIPRSAFPDSPLANLVDTRQGTDSSFAFSTGNTIPLTTMPHGMIGWAPQTD